MPMEWTSLREPLRFGGYAGWEEAREALGAEAVVPVFLRLRQVGEAGLAETIAAVLALPEVMFSQHERDLLETERALAPAGWPHEVRCVGYVARAALGQLPGYLEVMAVGPAVQAPVTATGGGAVLRCSGAGGSVPVVAVLDDGIGFLNARFRAAADRTRIAALWLQSAEGAVPDAGQASPDMICGRVLEAAEIDAMIRSGQPEDEIYRGVNAGLVPKGERASTNHRVSHGTHILDLAAGADWAMLDPVLQVPILAVQLPSAALRETAGRRLEGYIVQGLRWVVARAMRMAAGGAMPPLVISLSIGSLGGPGDDTEFLADWMRYEIARHVRMAPGAELRITAAHGNSRKARLTARAELRRTAPFTLDWRVLPDDHSASFLEIRVAKDKTKRLNLCLTPPKGTGWPAVQMAWPEAGQGLHLQDGKAPVAAITAHVAGHQAMLHLALAPTAGLGETALSAPGLWKVKITSAHEEPVHITAKVQRDDTPAGYRTFGRQSWLDHPEAWNWDEESRDYTAPMAQTGAKLGPITREGSAVAFAGVNCPEVYLVGAARPILGLPEDFEPSPYSAEAAQNLRLPEEPEGPSLAALGDDGILLAGRQASGVLSGSVARLSGTSVAAPAVARALLGYFLTTTAAYRSAKAEWVALLGHVPNGPVSPVLGHGVLITQQGAPAEMLLS